MDTQTAQRSAADAPPAPAPRMHGRPHLAVPVLVGLALLLGVLVRLGTRSELWLDEALSVAIAEPSLAGLPARLRQDGAPPLYYLLLHGWTAAFGTGTGAVRALSQLAGLAALPVAWLAGRRLGGPAAGWTAVLLLASNPFAVHYANETRMYALVVLLVLLGVLAVDAALRAPRPARLVAVGLLSGLLLLTHYWSLFLLTVVGAGLAVAALRGHRPALRVTVAVAAGGLLFLPWLPVFLFQLAHTGAPWARPPGLEAVLGTWTGWAGRGAAASVLALLLLGLALLAALGRPSRGPDGGQGVLLRLPAYAPGALLAGTALATLLLGVGVAAVQSSGYALRYSSVALAPALLAAALGARVLPARARVVIVGAAVVLGLAGSLPEPFSERKTQAGVTATALRERLAPGDLVVYCPDQLGPAVSRLLPPGTAQAVYPTGGSPRRVDWVDYAERNAQGDPAAFAEAVARRTSGTVWLVAADGYRTYGSQCRALDEALTAERRGRELVLRPQQRFDERMRLVRYT